MTYIKFFGCDSDNAIQWVPINSYSLRFIANIPSSILSNFLIILWINTIKLMFVLMVLYFKIS